MNKKKNQEAVSVKQKNAKAGLSGMCFLVISAILVSGAFYLYQVNDLATKGYEIKEAESRIQDLQKAAKNMEIKEVELRSMYNIEKSTQDLNLVNAQNVSYVEMASPVAMK